MSAKFVSASITKEELRRDDEYWAPPREEMRADLLRRLPVLVPNFREWLLFDPRSESAEDFTRRFLAQPGGGSWCLDVNPDLFCELAYEGFGSMCCELDVGSFLVQVILPWNDSKRNTLDWGDMHISKKARKRAKQYTLSVDAAFDDVLLGCIRMHGEAWLYRGLRWLLRGLFHMGYRGGRDINVGVHSFELWDKNGQLVAGDLGYTVGGVYHSMSGFRSQGAQGAGEVQMVLTAALLHNVGYDWWDLAQVMKYKVGLGAKVVSREDFVKRLLQDRSKPIKLSSEGRMPGQELMRGLLDFQASARKEAGPSPLIPSAEVDLTSGKQNVTAK